MTGRYLLAGGPVPRIYPQDVAALRKAYKDAIRESTEHPGRPFVVFLIDEDGRRPLQVYENGACTWFTGRKQYAE